MTENAFKRKYQIDNFITTVPLSPYVGLIILERQGDNVRTAFCNEDEPGWYYNPRWTKLRYYKSTDHFAKFIQRDGMKIDVTFVNI